MLFIAIALPCLLNATDCFGWSFTKRANYMEMLPSLLYYDQVNWINLDPSRACTFRTYEAVFLSLLSPDLTAQYQVYKKPESGKCELQA